MRYRVFDSKNIISTFDDRPYFYNRFHGKDPNNPVNGVLEVDGKPCIVVKYEEHEGKNHIENEFHAIECDFYANVFVEKIL